VARRVAFLIGNQTFQPDNGLLPLQGPANDIAVLARLLHDPVRGQFEVHEFLDKKHHEVLPDVERALYGASEGDFFLIYYSGHGQLARNGELCLATADTRPDALRTTSIPTRHLRDLVEESDSNQVLLILDCCYSGAVDDGRRGDVSSELQIVQDARGFYIITASTGVQAARETAPMLGGAVMGRFTAAVVNGIESGAADQGRKGRILLSDLRHYLGHVAIGSTPQFFDHKASGDPIISYSPGTAAPLLDADVLADLDADQWHRRHGAVSALASILRDGEVASRAAARAALQRRLAQERDYAVRAELAALLGHESVSAPDVSPPALPPTEPTTPSLATAAAATTSMLPEAESRERLRDPPAAEVSPGRSPPDPERTWVDSDESISRVPCLRLIADSTARLPAEQALTVARSIDDAWGRATVLAMIAPQLAAEARTRALGEALTASRGIDYNLYGIETLAEIAMQLPADARPSVLGEALIAARGIDNPQKRVWALKKIIGTRLPAESSPSILGQALNVARSIDGNERLGLWHRAEALAAIAAQLPADARPSVLDEALIAARCIDYGGMRCNALAEIAPQLRAEAQQGVLDEALAAARSVRGPGVRAGELAKIAPKLPAKVQQAVLDEMLAAARGIRDPDILRKLAEIVPQLPAEAQQRVLDEVLAAARSIDDLGMLGWALIDLAAQVPAEQALIVARSITDPKKRVWALLEIAEKRPSILGEALTVARSVDDAAMLEAVLTEISRLLPAEAQRSVLDEAVAAARSIDIHESAMRARALAEIARWVPAEAQPAVLDEAVSAARCSDNAWARAGALAQIAPQLPAEAQPQVLDEALTAARSIDNAYERAVRLAEIALRLPTVAQPNVLDEAVRAWNELKKSHGEAAPRPGS
jgi:hypothetical protein